MAICFDKRPINFTTNGLLLGWAVNGVLIKQPNQGADYVWVSTAHSLEFKNHRLKKGSIHYTSSLRLYDIGTGAMNWRFYFTDRTLILIFPVV